MPKPLPALWRRKKTAAELLASLPPTCPACGHALTAFCPRCRGRTGGAVKSPKQAAAGKRNVEKARLARATKSPPKATT